MNTYSSFSLSEWKEPLLYTPTFLISGTERMLKERKYFSEDCLLHNCLVANALQNLLFGIPKQAVLHGKSIGLASQNSLYCNVKTQLSLFKRIILTKQKESLESANLISTHKKGPQI